MHEKRERYNNERYVVGTHPIPEWCWRDMMIYRRDDGSTGYEFTIHHSQQGHTTTLYPQKGDTIIKNGALVRLIPKKEEPETDAGKKQGSKRLFEAARKA